MCLATRNCREPKTLKTQREDRAHMTKAQTAYLLGWRHGSKDEIKKGPANQKDEALRVAYLQGFKHGLNDLEMAEHHAKTTYG